MLQQLKKLGTIAITDPVLRRQGRALQIMLLALEFLAIAGLPISLSTPGEPAARWLSVGVNLVLLLAVLLALWRLHSGDLHGAVVVAALSILAGLLVNLLNTGIENGVGLVLAIALPITLTGMLSSRRMLIATTALSCLIVVGIATLELRSPPFARLLPGDGYPLPLKVTAVVLSVLTLALLVEILSSTLHQSLADLRAANQLLASQLAEQGTSEALVREREAFLTSIYDGIATPMFVIDVGDDHIYRFAGANSAYEQAMNLRRSDLIGRRIEEVFPAERLDAIREVYDRCVREGVSQFEEQFVPWNTSRVWWLRILTPLRDASGRVTRLVGTGIDISERRATEEALRESEGRYRRLAENIPDVLYRYRIQPRRGFEYVNPAAIHVFGFTPEQHYADPQIWRRFVHPDDLSILTDFIERSPNNSEPATFRIIQPSNRVVWVELREVGTYNVDGALVAVEGIARDITRQREAEAALRGSEERFRLIAENTSDLICLLDMEQRYVYASPSYKSLLGYDPATLLGRISLELIHPEDYARMQQAALQFQERGGMQLIYRFCHADGSWRWLDSHLTMVDHQEQRYLIVISRDITLQRHLEAQLIQAHKMEGIGRLAGGVAHDFNNLLAVISGSADIIREITGPGHPAQAEIDDILAAAERGSALTRQLLALGRDQPSTLQLFDLNDLLTSCERLLLRLIPSETRLEFNLASSGGLIRADPDQLTQVLMNLVINANDAMPNGGQITISTATVVVTPGEAQAARALQSGPHILLTVGDTGTGMDEETLRKVFEPFFTTKPASQGSGLGLAICYSIVRRHGGRIAIDSERGRGTAVRIYLPLAMHLAGAALVA